VSRPSGATAGRAAAARIVAAVAPGGETLSAALPAGLDGVAPAQRALVQELCYGTLRWRIRLQAILRRLLARPLKRRDADVEALLLIGLYQLLYLRVPPHAAVSETAGAARVLEKTWAVRLVNGVLRRFQREGDALCAQADADDATRLACPEWLLARLRADWPDAWQAIAQAGNARPPMTLRVNARRIDRDGWLQLAAGQLAGRPLACCPDAVALERPVDVQLLPGFAEGLVSVQDAAAQLACPLLGVPDNARVLDACAAPGGKTAHLLERAPAGMHLVAVDADPARLERVRETLQRLGLQADLCFGDAGDPGGWWGGEPFDRILLDAPCTATGVIRRHPDIRHLRRAGDVSRLAAQQRRLLDRLWPLLRPGGRLLYVTCSVLREENSDQATGFLERHDDAAAIPLDAEWGRPAGPGRQILPGEDGMDGFYYALIGKAGAAGTVAGPGRARAPGPDRHGDA